jgi:hypothetical protein
MAQPPNPPNVVAPTHDFSQGLKIIDDWWHKRLGHDESATPGTRALQEQFIEAHLSQIKRVLGIVKEDKNTFITVRSSFCRDNLYLRPIYSRPPPLEAYLQDHQLPFTLKTHSAFKGTKNRRYKTDTVNAFVANYKLNSTPDKDAGSFAGRINLFIEKMKNGAVPIVTPIAKDATDCFFAGRNRPNVAKNDISLKHLIAIYYCCARMKVLDNKALKRLEEHTKNLFDGLDLIAKIDASLFESEGLGLVAKLLPRFSNDEVAPADKIAYAIERLRKLIQGHMVGGHGGEAANAKLQLFYIATTFEKHEDGSFTPRLEIYPHVYREDNNYTAVSFRVTHRKIPSATKFLIWRYLTSKLHRIVATIESLDKEKLKTLKDLRDFSSKSSVRIHPVFAETVNPEKLQIDPVTVERITPPESPDFLLLTKSDETAWKSLQRAADDRSRSITAFVVEGDTIVADPANPIPCKYFPLGVFAVESPYEDGFSDADIVSLRLVFQGMASLIRANYHPHAPIDYRSQVAATFEDDVDQGLERRPDIQKLLFLVQKLDASLFQYLIGRQIFFDGLDSPAREALQAISKACPPGPPNPLPDERDDLLRDRMKHMQILLKKSRSNLDKLLHEDVMSYLQACPENFTWASYLACMAQTLGDRTDASKELPKFSRMLPGFSASGMFMAIVQGQLRQVVKLSVTEKLRKELNGYRKWVRYLLVNAARLPENGFAFDTKGEDGRNEGSGKRPSIDRAMSDGVLISDLVSAGENQPVSTLLDIVAELLDSPDNSQVKLETLHKELHAVFAQNAKNWETVQANDRPVYDDVQDSVCAAFRIESAKQKTEVGRALNSLPGGRKIKFQLLTSKWSGSLPVKKTMTDNNFYWVVAHRDLNARNLTWAAGVHSFFLIDFEQVGPSPRGCDQFRLMVNLVAESWTAWDQEVKRHNRNADRLFSELEAGINFIITLFELLFVYKEHLKEAAKNAKTQWGADSKLVCILHKIIETLQRPADNGDDEIPWYGYWSFVLFCAVTKEFAYTLRIAKAESIQGVLGTEAVRLELGRQLSDKIKVNSEREAGANRLRVASQRYVVTARLLLGVLRVLDVVKDA